jgi:hypothetical protein
MNDHLEEFLKLKNQSIEDLCEQTPITDVIPPSQKVVVIPATATVDQALSVS